MKTLTVPGDPETLSSIMVPKSQEFHDHEIIRVDSSNSDKTTEKKIFRIVDGGEDHWELQFE